MPRAAIAGADGATSKVRTIAAEHVDVGDAGQPAQRRADHPVDQAAHLLRVQRVRLAW